MIGELVVSFVGGRFHVEATTERGHNPETGAMFVQALGELITQPKIVAAVFGCTVDELTDALIARKASNTERPIIVNTPPSEGLN